MGMNERIARKPIEWCYQGDPFIAPPTQWQLERRRLQDAVIRVAEQLSDPLRMGRP
jgi:hypothetical protein